MWNWFTSLLRQITGVLWHATWHVLCFALWILPPFWDGKHYFYLAHRAWAPGALWITGSRVTFEGRERVDWTKPHVIIANHQGNADIPLLFMTVSTPLRFLAKRSVGHIPLLGWMLRLAKFPFVDRYNPAKGKQSIDKAAERIQTEKLNVVVFPEGTRSPEGTVLPFKKGAFQLAIQAQVPIVPIALIGSGIVLARGSFRVCPSPLKVIVGDPIPTEGLKLSDRDELCAQAEATLLGMLGWKRIRHTELERARREAEKARLARVT